MLTALFISTILSITIVLISFFILSKNSFFKDHRLLFLSIIAWYALWNAIFIVSPWVITMIWPKFIDIVWFWAIIFTILLTPILSILSENKEWQELTSNEKKIFFISLLWFLAIHTIAESISIGMTHTFFQNINIGELIIDIIHEAPEIAFIASMYYFYTYDKTKTLNLVFLVWMLYPIGALITSALVSNYNPWFVAYIKWFLLWWYIVFWTISLYIAWTSKNKKLYISVFLVIFILMFWYKLIFWVS